MPVVSDVHLSPVPQRAEQPLKMSDDLVFMGDLIYDYLVREASAASDQCPSDWLGYFPPQEDSYDNMGYLPPAPPSSSYTGSPTTTYVPALIHSRSCLTFHIRNTPLLVPASPSPSLSEPSSTPEYHPVSPKPSPTPEPSCCKASPVFNHIRKKYCCSGCDKGFRGKWECKRHILGAGKRATCLACGGNLTGREDSLKRHFTKYCKGDVENLRFEDTFIPS